MRGLFVPPVVDLSKEIAQGLFPYAAEHFLSITSSLHAGEGGATGLPAL